MFGVIICLDEKWMRYSHDGGININYKVARNPGKILKLEKGWLRTLDFKKGGSSNV